jgi:RimJ/RimL family protein N-acetyltransferase
VSGAARATTPIGPVVLSGRRVRMEPLDLDRHWEGLLAIGLDPQLWRYTLNVPQTPDDLRRYLETALREQRDGTAVPFATMDLTSGRVTGCTRFANIAVEHRRAEIGWTWVGTPWQRTHVNTEAKYLMLRQAFEGWGLMRVEFKTSARNLPSRNAMLRIGCVEEGTFRKHMLRDNGEIRDSMYFSIVDDEWPAVKARLEAMLPRES